MAFIWIIALSIAGFFLAVFLIYWILYAFRETLASCFVYALIGAIVMAIVGEIVALVLYFCGYAITDWVVVAISSGIGILIGIALGIND